MVSSLKTRGFFFAPQNTNICVFRPDSTERRKQLEVILTNSPFRIFFQLLKSGTSQPELDTIASYYFDGQGKALRPMVTMLMAKAINYHLNNESQWVLVDVTN